MLLDVICADRLDLIGHSMGGIVQTWLFECWPDAEAVETDTLKGTTE